jgi:hypothetical protein
MQSNGSSHRGENTLESFEMGYSGLLGQECKFLPFIQLHLTCFFHRTSNLTRGEVQGVAQ